VTAACSAAAGRDGSSGSKLSPAGGVLTAVTLAAHVEPPGALAKYVALMSSSPCSWAAADIC
jgi:hypothetical protein